MTWFLFLFWVISIVVGTYMQIRFAQSNYPRTRKWLALRLSLTFAEGAILGLFLFHQDYKGITLTIAVVLSGMAISLLDTFLSPHGIQYVIPKREDEKR